MPTFIMRAAKDDPAYIGWSTVVESPVWVAPDRDSALRIHDVTADRLDRADETGTSVLWELDGYPREGSWEDVAGEIYQQKGFIRREHFGEVARRLLADIDASLDDLVEPFDDWHDR